MKKYILISFLKLNIKRGISQSYKDIGGNPVERFGTFFQSDRYSNSDCKVHYLRFYSL